MNTELLRKIDELLCTHEYDKIKEVLLTYKNITEHSNELATIFYLTKIYEQEKDARQKTIFEKVQNVSQLLERYTVLKFYLRRIDFDVIGNGLQEFYLFLIQNEISSYELITIIEYSVVHKEKVLKVIKGKELHE
ncbi:MAG: hypothetical protein PUD93_02395 [Lachnospiraceae bacterium]|nr:hypothetical protein [Lachnospiraceae bacterium]